MKPEEFIEEAKLLAEGMQSQRSNLLRQAEMLRGKAQEIQEQRDALLAMVYGWENKTSP